MEGGYESSRPGPDGQAMVRTLEDFRTGQAPFVTIAGNPGLYGREYTIPEVSYAVGDRRHTLKNVPVVVHDTGGAFRDAPEGRFDVPVGRDLGPRDTNQGLSGVQFVPRQAMSYSDEPLIPAGARPMEGTIRPVPGADPIPPRPERMGQGRPWQDGSVRQSPAPPVGQDAPPPWEMDWSGAPPQSAAQPSGPMPWEMDWSGAQQPKQPAPSGIWNNLTAGANDMIYSAVGAPVDAATWLVNKGVQGVNAVTGADLPQARSNLPGSSRWLAGAGEAVGVNDPEKVQATSAEEKLARAAGAGAGGMIAPEAMLGLAGRAGVVGEGAMNMLGQAFGRSATAGDVATNAAVGAAAGVGGQMAGQVVPEPLRPLGEFAGNLLGGAAGAGAVAAGRSVAQLPQAWRDFRLSDPAVQEQAAGRRLQQAATDPSAVRDALDQRQPSLVAGSEPTTFQLTGDMGLGGLERASASKSPADFMQRRADQNAARTDALGKIQPNGAPEQVVTALRQNLSDLDAMTGRALDDATQAAREATGRIGGDMPADVYGAGLRDLETPRVNAARSEAQDAMARLGGQGTPEDRGVAMRQSILTARAVAKEREKTLWDAVDPEGTLNLSVTGSRAGARRMLASLPKLAEPMVGREAAVFAEATRLPDVIPFSEMTALRSRVSDVMADERRQNGKSVVYGRLSQLRGAIESDIEQAVVNKAALEQRAVQAGQMSEEDTMAAMLRRAQQDADAWKVRQVANEAGRSDAIGVGNAGTASAASISSGYGSQGKARGGPRVSAGNKGLQGNTGLFPDTIAPNLDEGAAGRLKEASEATKQRARTYDEGPVGLATRGPMADQFTMPASSIPGTFFTPGPGGFERVGALRRAVGDDAATIMLQDAAIADLRSKATRPDGTLDPAAYQRWRTAHANALRGLPALSRTIGSAEAASRSLDAARLLPEGVLDGDVPKRVFRPGPGGYESVNRFMQAVGDARARPILEDFAISDLKRFATREMDGTLNPAKVQMWRQRHADALRAMPDVEARLADPVTASEAMVEVASRRKEQLDAFQKGSVARLLNLDDPADVTRTIGGIFSRQDAVQQMTRLSKETAGSEEARQGLRKAVADFINLRFIGNTEGATSGADLMRSDAFHQFLRQSAPALKAVLSGPEIMTLHAIAADLKRSNRSVAAVKLPGQSNTVQDALAVGQAGGAQSWLARMISPGALAGAGAAAGSVAGGGLGAAAGAGAGAHFGRVIEAMRQAGLASVDDIVKDALLNPDRAKALLAKVSGEPTKSQAISLARVYMRALASGQITDNQ